MINSTVNLLAGLVSNAVIKCSHDGGRLSSNVITTSLFDGHLQVYELIRNRFHLVDVIKHIFGLLHLDYKELIHQEEDIR